MSSDKKLKEIINKVSNKNSLPAEETEEILEHFFKEMREAIKSDEMPTILIHNFGRFYPRINMVEHAYLKSPEGEHKNKLEKIKNRLEKEKHKRK